MLFYIGLFISSVIAAVGFLILYRSLEGLGKIIHRSFLPTASDGRAAPAKKRERIMATTVNETPAPWGWYGRTAARKEARARPANPGVRTPWGWPGSNNGNREREGGQGVFDAAPNQRDNDSKSEQIVSPDVGWPYRKEKFELAGKDNKVVRKATRKPTDLSKTGTPWGW